MKQIIVLFGFVVLVSFTSCGRIGVNFDPDIHMSDYEMDSIVGEDGVYISCQEPEFNEYACMHKSKWIELKALLTRIRLSKKDSKMLIEKTQKIDKAYKI